jgi:hypothetical protein
VTPSGRVGVRTHLSPGVRPRGRPPRRVPPSTASNPPAETGRPRQSGQAASAPLGGARRGCSQALDFSILLSVCCLATDRIAKERGRRHPRGSRDPPRRRRSRDGTARASPSLPPRPSPRTRCGACAPTVRARRRRNPEATRVASCVPSARVIVTGIFAGSTICSRFFPQDSIQ